MTLAEMEVLLKRYGFDNRDPLKPWLNAAMHEVEDAKDWPWLEHAPELVTMNAGENTITLPAEALKIITLKDETNIYKLQYYDWHKFERNIREPEERGLPEIYTLTGTNVIQIWRVLERTTNFRLKVQLSTKDLANPADVPTTGAVVWPTNAHFPIVLRAAAIALQAENEEDRAKAAQAQFDLAMTALAMKFDQRILDEPQSVEDVMGYGSNNPARWS